MRIGLADRGIAALMTFDPATVATTSTLASPAQPLPDIQHVFVNCQAVVDASAPIAARPGRLL